jgi:hypothetical protein
MTDQPRFGRIPDGMRLSGLSRGKLYGLAAQHRGLFLKADSATIVDLRKLDQVLAALPPAEITTGRAASGHLAAASNKTTDA